MGKKKKLPPVEMLSIEQRMRDLHTDFRAAGFKFFQIAFQSGVDTGDPNLCLRWFARDEKHEYGNVMDNTSLDACMDNAEEFLADIQNVCRECGQNKPGKS